MAQLDYSTAPPPLPAWITASEPLRPVPLTSPERKALAVVIFDSIFDDLLEKVMEGQSIQTLIEEDPRDLKYGQFMRWVRGDDERSKRFDDAQEINADYLVDQLVPISSGANSLEDVQRSQLRVSTIKWVAEKRNRKRYGDTKQIDINTTTTINLRAVLEERESRIIDAIGMCTVVDKIGGGDE